MSRLEDQPIARTPSQTPASSLVTSSDFTLDMTGLSDPLTARSAGTAGFHPDPLAQSEASSHFQTPKSTSRTNHIGGTHRSNPYLNPVPQFPDMSKLVFPSYGPDDVFGGPSIGVPNFLRTNRSSSGSRRSTQKAKTSTPIDSDYFADQEAVSDDNRLGSPFNDAAKVKTPKSSLRLPGEGELRDRPRKSSERHSRRSGENLGRESTSHRRMASYGKIVAPDKGRDNIDALFGFRDPLVESRNILGLSSPITIYSAHPVPVSPSLSKYPNTSKLDTTNPSPQISSQAQAQTPISPRTSPFRSSTLQESKIRHLSLPSPRIPAISHTPSDRTAKKRKSTDEVETDIRPAHLFNRSASGPNTTTAPRSILKSTHSSNLSGQQ